MLFCNRWIKSIFLVLGVYLITINIIIWANNTETAQILSKTGYQSIIDLKTSHVNFHGFHWFFDKLSTFQGLRYTYGIFNTYCNIVSNFSFTDNVGLDIVVAIFRVLTTPIVLSVTIVIDIINNIGWLFNFIKEGLQ